MLITISCSLNILKFLNLFGRQSSGKYNFSYRNLASKERQSNHTQEIIFGMFNVLFNHHAKTYYNAQDNCEKKQSIPYYQSLLTVFDFFAVQLLIFDILEVYVYKSDSWL
jgi:hypothetical protein